MSDKPPFDLEIKPDRWRRWVHNPAWDKAKPERNPTLLTNTPAGRIHAATLSNNKVKIFSSWAEYKKAVRESYRPPLWKRVYYWLRYQLGL